MRGSTCVVDDDVKSTMPSDYSIDKRAYGISVANIALHKLDLRRKVPGTWDTPTTGDDRCVAGKERDANAFAQTFRSAGNEDDSACAIQLISHTNTVVRELTRRQFPVELARLCPRFDMYAMQTVDMNRIFKVGGQPSAVSRQPS